MLLFLLLIGITASLEAAPPAAPDYNKQVAPILKKYCAGCHNNDDREGDFSLETYAEIQKGGEHGPAILPGDAKSSRLVRLLTGAAELAMPPEDEAQLKPDEIALITAWVAGGAKGPQGAEPRPTNAADAQDSTLGESRKSNCLGRVFPRWKTTRRRPIS